jgi:signal transduction histidine kinase/CheY-like chemotaxis protein
VCRAVHLADLLDLSMLRRLAEANYRASGMPIGLVDATTGAVLVGFGWQDICTLYHRAHPITLQRCRESDEHIRAHLTDRAPCEYTCRNGLRDIGVPIRVGGEHVATLFLGQFFYEGESPDRQFFVDQARELGFDERSYLDALDRVPVFRRTAVENILVYNSALAEFISDLAEAALQRRRAEERAEFLARFPQENPDPVFRLSSQLSVLYANDGAREALAEAGVAPGAPAPPVIAALARRAALERRRVQGEISSGDRVFSMSVIAVGDDVNVYAHDVTARVRAEEALRQASRAKDDFIGMLSHELRNPLAPVRNALYVLDHADPAGQQARRAKEVAARQVAHLTRLVDDLLDVTRIVRGKVELRRTPLDVAALVRRTAEDHRALMHERGLELDVDAPVEPLWIDGDETRLAQAIGNLIQNAAKFTPAGGRVGLSARAAPDAVEVVVVDDGAGIDPALLTAIFEPFVQAKQSLARTEGGLGLGLALVKGLVELHDGAIVAESAGPGTGSQFTIRLPPLRSSAIAAAPHVEALAAAHHRRVLVVDDNRDAAESLAELVQMFGHDTEVAFDGPSALEKMRASPPDVVLCDIGLPGMDGYEVARAIRTDARLQRVRLVAVSGYALPEDRERAFQAGFDEHIPKPPNPDRIEQYLAYD